MARTGDRVRFLFNARTTLGGREGKIIHVKRGIILVEFAEPTGFGLRLWFRDYEIEVCERG